MDHHSPRRSQWAPWVHTGIVTSHSAARALIWLLRLFGISSLFAIIFVVAPHDWMRAIHAWAELGAMPDTPVVWYLARSTSAFYVIVGGLFLLVSFDLERYRQVLVYLSWSVTFLGSVLLVVDVAEGMPMAWTVGEGPFVILFGIVLLYLNRSIPSGASPTQT